VAEISLIVGLGNPGQAYVDTRHNCGFMVVDHLSQRWQIPLQLEKRFQGLYGEGRSPHTKQRLLKPETYMNLSGQSVRAVLDWYKLDPALILVIYDDMDLPLGRLRLRASGSAGGHNGMKSLIQHLGTDSFPRLRIGIGNPQGKKEVVGHVLGGFTPAEKPCLTQVLKAAADSVETILKQDLLAAMNQFNALTICAPDPING
jgi:PTH1 family peptidyl-tRNA hydrolase